MSAPVTPSPVGDAPISGFVETFGAILATFVIPTFVGFLVISAASSYIGVKYLVRVTPKAERGAES